MNFDVLEKVRKNKTLLSLPWKEMEELKQFLEQNFGISKWPDGLDLVKAIRANCGAQIAEKYENIHDIRAYGTPPEKQAATIKFYDLICNDPLLGLVHSTKFPLIFDAIAYISALLKLVEFDGDVLDIGCHAGYQTLWIAQELQCISRGIDTSRPAIQYARLRGKKLGLTPQMATFDKVVFGKDQIRDKASLVLAVDLPMDLPDLFHHGASVLSANGLFVYMGYNTKGFDYSELRNAISSAGLTLEINDVVGGWDGFKFESSQVLVLRHGADPRVSNDPGQESASLWDSGFKDYSNTPGRPTEEKTVSQYRTFATHGSKHGQ